MKRLATDTDMALIGRLTRLEKLMVRGKLVTAAGCAHCRGLTRLRVLWLQGSSSITSRGLECFLGAKGLTDLELGGDSLGDEAMDFVAQFLRGCQKTEK